MTRPELTSATDEPATPASTNRGDGGLVRYRIDLAYDGTAYAGWARQPGQHTVQGVLEDALTVVLRPSSPIVLTVAGRTDAGVHARGQVAHFDIADVPPDDVVRRLDGLLPRDIRVRRLAAAPAGFEARFSALSRRYSYRIADGFADPLRRTDTLSHSRPLDLQAMNTAARQLLGEHDFAAYCKQREGASAVRRLLTLEWRRDDDAVALATVEADAFCHNMVRSLVGALVAVGEHRRPVGWPAEVLAAGVRDAGAVVVPACGLTLEQVRYPPDDELAARAAQTRAYRGRP